MNRLITSRTFFTYVLTACLASSLTAGTKNNTQHQGTITYKEIGDLYLSSWGQIDIPKPHESSGEPKKPDLSIPILSQQEKRHILFELLARNEKQSSPTNQQAVDALRIALKDLDVFYGTGQNSQETLMSAINNTQTTFGEAVLAYELAHPLADISLLKNRQAFIKELVANQDLFNQLDQILSQVKNAESGVFSFWKKHDPVSQKLFKQLYFSNSWFTRFNNDSGALETRVRLDNLGTAWQCGGDAVIALSTYYLMQNLTVFGMKKLMEVGRANLVDPEKIAQADHSLAELNKLNPSIKQALYSAYQTAKWLLDPRQYIADIKSSAQLPNRNMRTFGYALTATKAGLVALYVSHKVKIIKTAVEQAQQTKDAINYLQNKLINLATILDGCKQLQSLAANNAFMHNGLRTFNTIENIFNLENKSASFAQLIDILQTNTFKGSASFFSLSGRVLAANHVMENEKEQFASLFQAIGEIDACLSMAKLYKKMSNERVGYCFVEFVNASKPTIRLLDFWNPFISPRTVVTNDLMLGNDIPSKVILTGSNTGGKSTILKAIMLNMLLAHTFGMGTAKSFSLSTFSFLGSYLRIKDDIASGHSQFKAEVLRAQQLIETMIHLPKDQFGFIIIDELFTGTGAEKAASAAYKVAQKLATLDNSSYILATHFPQLTLLENELPAVVKNCKVDVLKDDAGNLIRPFKLEAGISNSNVANDILNEQITDIDFN